MGKQYRKAASAEKVRSWEEGAGWRIFDIAVLSVVSIFVLLGVLSVLVSPKQEVNRPAAGKIPVPSDAYVLQLLNGSGESSFINGLCDSLRVRKLDVRSVVRKTSAIYPQTYLIDRKNNTAKTDSIATLLGIPPQRIILHRDEDIYDFTILIGRDYPFILKKLFEKPKV